LATYVERALTIAEEDLEEGEVAPTPRAVQAAREHFRQVEAQWPAGSPIPLPHVCAPGDGDISLEWAIGNRRLFVTVYPTGLIRAFCAEVRDGRAADPRTTSDPAPDDTVSSLLWLAGAA